MNILETIYYSQYFELKTTGRDWKKGRLNGTLLSAVIIMLNLVSLTILLFKITPHTPLQRWLEHLTISYEHNGKMLGKLLGIVLLIVIGGLLRFTIGSEKSYNKIIEKFSGLPEEVQKKTIKKSLYVFLVTFAVFLLLVFAI